MIRILSLPSRHPYMSKFHRRNGIVFVNPNTDYFNKIGGNTSISFLNKKHPPQTYDLVHVHFSFDKLSVKDLKSLLSYFKKNNKPIVWTCHGIISQRKRNIGKGKLQQILFTESDAIITLTKGCKKLILKNFGSTKPINIISHGFIMDPKIIKKYKKDLDKKGRGNFVYLVGDLRENKEILFSIKSFLQNEKFQKYKLTVIYKKTNKENSRTKKFLKLIESKKIKTMCLPEISNNLLNKIFCQSHVCLLPYLWGTHSGQIELCRDCGVYSVISNVGFYKDQYSKIIEFKFNKNLQIFSNNLIKSLEKASNLNLLKPQKKLREKEFKKILNRHIHIYKKLIQ